MRGVVQHLVTHHDHKKSGLNDYIKICMEELWPLKSHFLIPRYLPMQNSSPCNWETLQDLIHERWEKFESLLFNDTIALFTDLDMTYEESSYLKLRLELLQDLANHLRASLVGEMPWESYHTYRLILLTIHEVFESYAHEEHRHGSHPPNSVKTIRYELMQAEETLQKRYNRLHKRVEPQMNPAVHDYPRFTMRPRSRAAFDAVRAAVSMGMMNKVGKPQNSSRRNTAHTSMPAVPIGQAMGARRNTDAPNRFVTAAALGSGQSAKAFSFDSREKAMIVEAGVKIPTGMRPGMHGDGRNIPDTKPPGASS